MNGLYYYPNQVQNGQELITRIDEMQWLSEYSGDRRYQHYGHTFNYISEVGACPMPDFLAPLIEHMEGMCKLVLMNDDHDFHTPYFNQCTVNELLPGQRIAPHTDHHGYGSLIATVTLGTGATTVFRSDTVFQLEEVYSFYAQPNSVYYMEGTARWNATHEVPGATEDNDEGNIIPRGRQITLVFRHV
jgi:alkylated DNA repair dioxygenase AlkB